MELLQLTYFQVVARLEHMTRAAGELNITQPSLSKAINRLEREIGVPLFDRQGRGIRLNQYGARFLEHVEQVFRQLNAATDEIPDTAGMDYATVSLAAGALHWLPDVLRPFQAAHPAVRFRLFQRSLAELHQLLETGETDFCFVPAAPSAPSAPAMPVVHWHHLRTEDIFLVVPSSHRFAGQASVSLREIAQEDMILGKRGDVLREIMEGYFRQVGFTPRVACEADEPAAVEDYVAAALGVAFIPGMIRPLPNHDMTSWVRITEPTCQLTMGIAWNELRYLSQAAHAFRRQVMEYYAGDGQAVTAQPEAPVAPPTRAWEQGAETDTDDPVRGRR
jgi:DNA-binding transcriptional LysR family regulator